MDKSKYIDINKVKLTVLATFDDGEEILVPLSDVRKALQMAPEEDVVPRRATIKNIFEEIDQKLEENYNRYVFGRTDLDDLEKEALIEFADEIRDSIEKLKGKWESNHDQS